MTEQAPPLFNELAEKFKPSDDIIQTALHIKEEYAYLFCLKSVVDGNKLQQTIIRPFFEMASESSYLSYIQSLPIQEKLPDKDQLFIKLTYGYAVIVIQEEFFLLDLRLLLDSGMLDVRNEPTIHGPGKALSESIESTVNVISQRYHNPSLKIEFLELGDLSNRAVCLAYDNDRVNQVVLEKVRKRLDELKPKLIQTSGDLQKLLSNKKYTLFPTAILTERADRVIYNLAAGKVVIAVDGSPNVIILPVIFFDFMSSMDDIYHGFNVATFTVLLRYTGLLICVLLPSLYIAMVSYAPDIMRIELALTVAGSRIGVPFPSFLEVLFMLFFMELLTEASMRLPKTISSTATTVGGLILGTAATEAAITSNIMIIIVSAVAISTFVIPISEMSFAIRVVRLYLIIYTALFGIVGLFVGFLGIIMLLVNKSSLGTPYLWIPWTDKKDEMKVADK